MNTDYPSQREQVDVWPGLHDNDIIKDFLTHWDIFVCNEFNDYNCLHWCSNKGVLMF